MLFRGLSLFCLLVFVTGCGSGGSGGWIPLGIGAGGGKEGRIELRVAWPGAVTKGKLIPAAADRIEIVVTGEGLSSPVTKTVSKDQVQNGQVTVSFADVPTGSKMVEVKALDSTGAIVAHRIATFSVQENQTATITTELGVTITDGSYIPSQFTLSKGETLLWVNGGSQSHTVRADNGWFDSGNLAPGDSFSWAAATPGNVPFRCATHGEKTGTLVVQFPPPSVGSLSPVSGPAGTKLTLTGTNFGAQQSGSTVTVGGIPATVVSWSDTQLVCTVPSGTGVTDGLVRVKVAGVSSNSFSFIVTPSMAWTRTYDDPANGNDQGAGIAADAAGNVYVTGYEVRTDLGQSLNTWIRKYDPNGNPLWTQTYNSPANNADGGAGVAVDASGFVYVAGYETRNDLGQQANVWVRAYSPSGVIVWTMTYNSPANSGDAATGIALDQGGNAYISGYEARFDLGQNTNILFQKLGTGGLPIWSQTYNNPGNTADQAFGVTTDASGNVHVTGYETGDPGANENIWVRKHDPNGNTLWTRTYENPENANDRGQGIAADASGNVYVTGYETVWAPVFNENIWVRKYDLLGNVLWTRTYDSPASGNDHGQGIAVDSYGNVYVGGYETRADLGQNENIWIRKYDPNGNILWTETYDSPGNDRDFGLAITVDGAGHVYVTGYETRTDLGQGQNIWVRKYRQ